MKTIPNINLRKRAVSRKQNITALANRVLISFHLMRGYAG